MKMFHYAPFNRAAGIQDVFHFRHQLRPGGPGRQEVEKGRVPDAAVFDHLRHALHEHRQRQGVQHLRIHEHQPGLPEGPRQILPVLQIHGHLAPYGGIHLGQQGGGDLHEVHPPQDGGGVSQLIGTGGRDLSEKIGGLMMLDAIGMLENDPQTEIIALISKPPAPAVARKVLERARACRKPVVVCFLGRVETPVDEQGLQFARGSKEAALKAVMLSGVKQENLDLHTLNQPLIADVRARLQPQQKYIRGLFCGGTLCDETMFAVMEKHGDVYSNIQPDPEFRLQDINRSIKHTFLDFGDDDFTNGKPHPMIDPTNRISRLIEEARDPEVAVIVMDFVLGFGSHEDPVGSTIEAIKEAKAIAAAEGRELIILAYVLGTDLDTPSLEQQSQMLLDAGVILASSSTNTGLLAREFICKGEEA